MIAKMQILLVLLLASVNLPSSAASRRMLRGDAERQRRLQTNCLLEVDDCKAVPACAQCRLEVNFEISKPSVINCKTMIDYCEYHEHQLQRCPLFQLSAQPPHAVNTKHKYLCANYHHGLSCLLYLLAVYRQVNLPSNMQPFRGWTSRCCNQVCCQ
jgi:hypothetical protein